jgi:hypothetical protein
MNTHVYKKKRDKCHGSFTIESNEIKNILFISSILKVYSALSKFVVKYENIFFLEDDVV